MKTKKCINCDYKEDIKRETIAECIKEIDEWYNEIEACFNKGSDYQPAFNFKPIIYEDLLNLKAKLQAQMEKQ